MARRSARTSPERAHATVHRSAPSPSGRRSSVTVFRDDYDSFGLEDRRTWHPAASWGDSPLDWRPPGQLPALSRPLLTIGRPARAAGRRTTPLALPPLPPRVAFALPRKVVLCVKRKQRREVLHALNPLSRLRGFGGAGRRTAWSSHGCR